MTLAELIFELEHIQNTGDRDHNERVVKFEDGFGITSEVTNAELSHGIIYLDGM